MATQAGVGEANAGILASVFTLTSIPFSMIIPSLITKLSDRNRHLMLVATVLAGLIGVGYASSQYRQLCVLVGP